MFQCYIKGKLIKEETSPQTKEYYFDKYFKKIKISNEAIVSKAAKELANLFRNSKINYQNNVPFIGAVILCMRFNYEINTETTRTILNSISQGLESIIAETPLAKKQKKEFLKSMLGEPTLVKAKIENMYLIIQSISTIYNFINISADDYNGHDIMNGFLRIFRRWNSANAKQKGEVFTPDHITKLMYKLAKCSKNNVILDPACGSGSFLTNSMVEMFSEATDKDEQKDIKENHLIGIEVDDFNATLAGINMMLHGDGSSMIFCEDCFSALSRYKNCYDRVLMNPPFSQNSDPELKFVKYALEYMKKDGILAAILPKSCLKISAYDTTNLEYMKDIMSKSNIECVVSLPKDIFYPISPATCVLILRKTNKKHNCQTLLIDCSNDGFVISNDARIDTGKWAEIEKEVLEAYNFKELKNTTDQRAITHTFNFDEIFADELLLTEMLFEAFSSHRPLDIDKGIFARYLRENISSKILCGKELVKNSIKSWNKIADNFKLVPISKILVSLGKGKEKKSIDRKLEDKYCMNGIPLIVAKKDNNGVGGMVENYNVKFENKICIIAGGDGGGGKTYYCDFEFAATGFVMVCDFINEYVKADKYAKFYISVVISERLFKTIGHGRTISDVPSKINIKLPFTKQDKPDFDYMSDFIKSLPLAQWL